MSLIIIIFSSLTFTSKVIFIKVSEVKKNIKKQIPYLLRQALCTNSFEGKNLLLISCLMTFQVDIQQVLKN